MQGKRELLTQADATQELVERVGHIDVLVANRATDARLGKAIPFSGGWAQ